MAGGRLSRRLAAALSLALACGPAHAQSPIPLRYTWFGDPPANADEAHWFTLFDDQLEIALRSPAFSAHLTIDRGGGRERDEFAAL